MDANTIGDDYLTSYPGKAFNDLLHYCVMGGVKVLYMELDDSFDDPDATLQMFPPGAKSYAGTLDLLAPVCSITRKKQQSLGRMVGVVGGGLMGWWW